MLSRRTILETAAQATALHRRIHETVALRDRGPKERQAWSDACEEFHSTKLATDFLWEDSFLHRLRTGERDAIEEAIQFLEVDPWFFPWFFRSGYLKERLIRGLKVCRRTERDDLRLRNVIWNVATGPNRREFRNYCSLAIKVATEEFMERLAATTEAQDSAARGKLSYLRRFLLQQNIPAA